jgi:hypothetical protein
VRDVVSAKAQQYNPPRPICKLHHQIKFQVIYALFSILVPDESHRKKIRAMSKVAFSKLKNTVFQLEYIFPSWKRAISNLDIFSKLENTAAGYRMGKGIRQAPRVKRLCHADHV